MRSSFRSTLHKKADARMATFQPTVTIVYPGMVLMKQTSRADLLETQAKQTVVHRKPSKCCGVVTGVN